jgi:hypothetical protein
MHKSVFKLKSSMQARFKCFQSAPSIESVGTGSESRETETATFEDLMNMKTKENLAWYFHPFIYRASLSIVLVISPTKISHSCPCCAPYTRSMSLMHSAQAPLLGQVCFFFCLALAEPYHQERFVSCLSGDECRFGNDGKSDCFMLITGVMLLCVAGATAALQGLG